VKGEEEKELQCGYEKCALKREKDKGSEMEKKYYLLKQINES
jgi:hypothetical protein